VRAPTIFLLCARTFAGPGDVLAIDVAPTYPLFRIAAHLPEPRPARTGPP
jgi:hypothetical protein